MFDWDGDGKVDFTEEMLSFALFQEMCKNSGGHDPKPRGDGGCLKWFLIGLAIFLVILFFS